MGLLGQIKSCYCKLNGRVSALENQTDLDNQVLTNNDVAGVTQSITISNGNTIPISHPDGGCANTRGTRAAILALRNSGSLVPGCHYVVTDPSADGNLDVQEILLHATDVNVLGMQADILTSHDTLAWEGTYDIDANNVLEVTDNLENNVTENSSILTFPFGVATVTANTVEGGTLNHTGGTVNGNEIGTDAIVNVSAGNFIENSVSPEANVTSSGNTQRNVFSGESNTTITAGDFLENKVGTDATVNSSTTGDVDNNIFEQLSNTTITGGNVDATTVKTDANLTQSAGATYAVEIGQSSNLTNSGASFSDSTIAEDSTVNLISGTQYENRYGNSVTYNQVGTGYARYSVFEGNNQIDVGNVNFSNVQVYNTRVNTTGSTGTISNTTINNSLLSSLTNIDTLSITNSEFNSYATVTGNNADRLVIDRTTVSDNGRILTVAGSELEISYSNVNAYGYIQVSNANADLRVRYSEVSSLGYISDQTTTVGRNLVERVEVSSSGSIRFTGTTTGGRVYYSNVSSGATIYQNSCVNCYHYYCESTSLSQVYMQGKRNGRFYYCSADSYSYIRSLRGAGQPIFYYCSASSRGFIEEFDATARIRFYAVRAESQSIARASGTAAASNLYYSSFTAYYYFLGVLTGGTRSALHGYGRQNFSGMPATNGAATRNW